MKRVFLFALMLVSVLTLPSTAELTFFTDRTAWETAVAEPVTVEDFDSIGTYQLIEGINNAGLIDIELINLAGQNEWNAVTSGGSQNVNGTVFYQGGCNANSETVSNSGADFIDLHLPRPVMAFGADFASTHSGDGLTLSVNGETFEFSNLLPAEQGSGFVGFISTEHFSVVRLFDADKREAFGVDNVSFALTPEPGTIALLALGGLGILRKRK